MTRKRLNKGHNYNGTTTTKKEKNIISLPPREKGEEIISGEAHDIASEDKKKDSTDSPTSSVTLDNGQIREYNKFVQEAQDWYFNAFKKDPKDRTIFERYSVKLIENEIALRIDGQYRIYLLTKNTTNYHETKT